MAQASGITELTAPLRISVRRTKLTEEQFMELRQENPELRLELTAQGELIIMPPVGSEGGAVVFSFSLLFGRIRMELVSPLMLLQGSPCRTALYARRMRHGYDVNAGKR